MIRLAIRCRRADAERVLADLVELVPGGVEEEEGSEWVEYAIYGPPGELPALPELEATVGSAPIEVSSTEIPDDWADRWRDFHEPTVIAGGRLIVRPSWFEPTTAHHPVGADAEADDKSPSRRRGQGIQAGAEQPTGVSVVIDPGQAFGTGAHATTRICLELLLELADAGEAARPLADLGTGSGVLAIAAAKLGWNPVLGCDSELAAIEAARENAAANGVEISFERRNLRTEPPPAAATVVANLTAPLLGDVARSLAGSDAPRRLVCSGLLATEIDDVAAAFAPVGLAPATTRVSGDWAGILFRAA